MDNNQAMREFLREKINVDVITKYIFIKSMEEKYDDEYLSKMYRIDCRNIRQNYSLIPEEERGRIESNIRKQIESGVIDLKKEAVIWHKEGLEKESNRAINKRNANKKREGR